MSLTIGLSTKKGILFHSLTHNLAPMAERAGLYEALWHPESLGVKRAYQLIEPLEKGLANLLANPNLQELNPPNGWGSYEGLIRFLYILIEDCKQNPKSRIYVSR